MGNHLACILLGSNLQPEHHLPQAVLQLEEELEIVQVSSVWETPPVGSEGPNFLNAAVLVRTSLDAADLKKQLLVPLELRLGRVRTKDRYAARTIDLDLILFDGQVVDDALWHFAHRAVPVAEIMPELTSSSGERLHSAAARLSAETPIRLRPDVIVRLSGTGSPQVDALHES